MIIYFQYSAIDLLPGVVIEFVNWELYVKNSGMKGKSFYIDPEKNNFDKESFMISLIKNIECGVKSVVVIERMRYIEHGQKIE